MTSWELFDPAVADPPPPPMGPVVRVSQSGRLLFNRQAWALLAGPLCGRREVALVFDQDARVAGVWPALRHEAPASAMLTVDTMRSQEWPHSVQAVLFVDHHQVGLGEYPARLLMDRQVLTFEVGAPRRRPVGVPPGGAAEEDEGVAPGGPER